MDYCGMDVGKKSSNICIVDEKRRILREGKVRNRLPEMARTFGALPPMRIVLEASGKAFWLAERLREFGHEPIVVDPGRTKAIGSAKIKHDKLDARILAELCAADLLAVVEPPTEEQRHSRMSVVARDGLVRSRVRLVNMVRGMLDSEGFEVRKCSLDTFVKKATECWEELPEEMASALEPLITAIHMLTEQIAHCDSRLAEAVSKDDDAKLLMTTPGVGPVVVAYFMMAVRDPGRFRSGRQVGAYLGLVPSLYQSGLTFRRGRITKRGNSAARWALCCAANVLLGPKMRGDCALREWGLRLVERLGRKKAVTAVARKLAVVMWAMWKKQAVFEPRLSAAA